MCKASLCKKQDGNKMQMHISTGAAVMESTAVFTTSTCSCRCFSTLLWQAGQSAHEHAIMLGPKTTIASEWDLSEESYCHEAHQSSTPGVKTVKPCITMSTHYAGCPAEAGVMSIWQRGFIRRSWIPSRSTSGFSSHPSSRLDSRLQWPVQ